MSRIRSRKNKNIENLLKIIKQQLPRVNISAIGKYLMGYFRLSTARDDKNDENCPSSFFERR